MSAAAMERGPSRKVGVLLAIGIFIFPWLFAWFLLRKGHSTASRVLGFGWLFVVILFGISRDDPKHPPKADGVEQQANQLEEAPGPAPRVVQIAEGAIYDIDRESAPKAFKAWGAEWVKKINAMQPMAAALVAQAPDCAVLETLALSDDRSTVRKSPVFFANCKEDVRVYISMAEIDAGTVPASENAKLSGLNDVDLLTACGDRTKALMKYPSTYSQKVFSSDVRRMGWGRARVEIAFEAKNDFGGELPGSAICTVEGSTLSMPEIGSR